MFTSSAYRRSRGRSLAFAEPLAVAVLGLSLATGSLSGVAYAQDVVSAERVVQADADTVRALLADPATTLSDNPDVLAYTIEDLPPCQLVHITTRGVTSPYHYTVKRCPTDLGFRETLVSGDAAIQSMDVEWRAEPHGDGTRVRLSILARIARVPQFLVNQHTRQSIARTLARLGSRTDDSAQ